MIADLPGTMPKRVVEENGCWIWQGAVGSSGYGSVTNGLGRSMLAHRRAWIAFNGEIPADLTIDHLCRNKRCVNPAHMELVSRSENARRARADYRECRRGHPQTSENVRVHTRANGVVTRECVACINLRLARARAA